MRRVYGRGVDVLGAAVPNPKSDYDQYYGPLSPAQLAELDRALTPAEQAAVSEYQGKEAEGYLAEERAKGGPRSETVVVTPRGAVIKSLAPPPTRPWWHWALMGAGGLLLGVGLYKASKGK